jgi:hypothetical protein
MAYENDITPMLEPAIPCSSDERTSILPTLVSFRARKTLRFAKCLAKGCGPMQWWYLICEKRPEGKANFLSVVHNGKVGRNVLRRLAKRSPHEVYLMDVLTKKSGVAAESILNPFFLGRT